MPSGPRATDIPPRTPPNGKAGDRRFPPPGPCIPDKLRWKRAVVGLHIPVMATEQGIPAFSRTGAGSRRTVRGGLGLAPWMLLALATGAAELPRMLRITPIQRSMGIAFATGTTEWVGLESSEDLRTWTPVVEVAAQTDSVLYVDVEPSVRAARMFRVRAPGVGLVEARARWDAARAANYTLVFERLSPTPPFQLSARVTVRDGTKEVTDLVADGVPMTEVEPFLFLTVEELFAELEQARSEPIRQVWVTYDPVLGFPARCTLDRRSGPTSSLNGVAQYRITNLVVLPNPNPG